MKTVRFKRYSRTPILLLALFCLISPFNGFSEWTSIDVGRAGGVYDFQYRSGMLYCATDSGLYSTSNNTSWSMDKLFDETTGQAMLASTMQTVQFTSATTAVMSGMMYMGNSEVIFQSVNSGESWAMVNLSNNGEWPRMLSKIRFITDLRGFAAGTNGRLLATTNGGTSWSALSSGTSGTLRDISFVNDTRGFIVGDNSIVKTENGGASWSAKAVNGELTAVSFFHPDSGYAAGGNTLFFTTNGGATWQPIAVPFTDITSLYAISGQKLCIGHSGGLGLGLDGCSFWETVPLLPAEQVTALCAVDSTRLYAGYEKGMIYYSATGTGHGRPMAKITSAATTVCPDSSLAFTTSGPSHYQYSWLRNGQAAGSGKSASITFPTPAAYDTISLVVSNGTFSDTAQQVIYVNPRFKPTVLVAAEKDSVCTGTKTKLYVYNAMRSETYSLIYKGTQVTSVTATRDTVTFTTPPIDSPMVFEVTVTIAYECETVTASSQVAVWAAPINIGAKVTVQKPMLLNGDSTTVVVEATDPLMSYQLFTDSDFSPGVCDASRDTTKQGNGKELTFATGPIRGTRSFAVKVTNTFGCSKFLATITKVTGREFYLKANTRSRYYIIGDTVSFENSSVADSLQWIFDSSCSVQHSRDTSPEVVYTTAGEKQIRLIGKMSFGAADTLTMNVHVFDTASSSKNVSFCRVDTVGPAFPVSHPMLVNVFALHGDSSGIAYCAGYYRYGFSNYNFFIRKLDGTGRILWERTDESMRVNSSIATLTTDSKGNIYAGGSFNGEQLQIGNATIVCETEANRVHQGFQNFLVKMDPDGNVVWVIQGVRDLYTNPTGVTDIVRINDNRFVMTIANPAWYTRFTDTTVTTMNTDIVVAEIDSSGRLVHLLTTPNSNYNPEMTGICFSIVPSWSSITIAHSVTVSPKLRLGPDGKIYLYGKFQHDKKFSDAVAVKGRGTGKNGCIAVIDVDMWKWDTAFVLYGSNQQTKYGTIESGILPVFDIDKQGNIYVAEMATDSGYYFGSDSLTFATMGFVAKYNSRGELLWKNAVAGGAISNIVLSGDNCILYGSTYGTAGFFSQKGSEKSARSNGDRDILLGAMSNNGEVSWLESLGGPGYDYGMYMGKNSDGRLYMAVMTDAATKYHNLAIPAKIGQISLISFSPSGDCTPYLPAAVKQRLVNLSTGESLTAELPHFKIGPVPATAGIDELHFSLVYKNTCTFDLSVFNSLGTSVHHQSGYHRVMLSGKVLTSIKPWNLRSTKGHVVTSGTYLAIIICTDSTTGKQWQDRCVIGVR